MDWMYKGPGHSNVDKEEYLLGKAVDKTFEESHRLGGAIADATPAPLLRREEPTKGDHSQVDISRKANEDPLVKIKLAEREKLKRARDKFLAHNVGKNKVDVASVGRTSSVPPPDHETLDAILSEKLDKFVHTTGMRSHEDDDVDALNRMIKKAFRIMKKELEKSDSSSDSSSEDEKLASRKKRSKKRRRGKSPSSSSSSPEEAPTKRGSSRPRSPSPGRYRRDKRGDRRSPSPGVSRRDRKEGTSRSPSGRDAKPRASLRRDRRERGRSRSRSGDRRRPTDRRRISPTVPEERRSENRVAETSNQQPSSSFRAPHPFRPRQAPLEKKLKLTPEEMEKKRREMLDNAQWREEQRKKNVAKLNADEEREARELKQGKGRGDALLARELRRATEGGETVESVLKANRKKLQRGGDFMSRD